MMSCKGEPCHNVKVVTCNPEVTSTNLGNSLSAYGVTAAYIYYSRPYLVVGALCSGPHFNQQWPALKILDDLCKLVCQIPCCGDFLSLEMCDNIIG